MNKDQFKDLILKHVKARSEYVSLLKYILGEYESQEFNGKEYTVEQAIRKTIANNNECIKLSGGTDSKSLKENEFLKTLLPNYLSVAELKNEIGPLNLDKSGASVGKAIKHLKANGLAFLSEDVKTAVME